MKRLIIIFLLILFVVGGGFLAYHLFNKESVAPAAPGKESSKIETVDPAVVAFYENIDEEAFWTDNGNIAFMGIHAPANVTDTYNWALNMLQTTLHQRREYEAKLASGVSENQLGVYPNIMEKWEAVAGKTMLIQPRQGQISDLSRCLIKTEWYPESKDALQCNKANSKIEAANLVNTNSFLLSRYHSQFGYNRFMEHPMLYVPSMGNDQINEHFLFLLYLATLSENHPDAAIQEWMQATVFLKKALADQNTLVTRAILLVLYGETQKTLIPLLGKDATLAAKYEKQLLEVLATPFGPKQMNIPSIFRADYNMLKPSLNSTDGELTPQNKNKFYQFFQEMVALAESNPKHFEEGKTAFINKWGNYKLPDGITKEDISQMGQMNEIDAKAMLEKVGQDTIIDFVIGGIAVGADLFKTMTAMDARTRMLNLYVQMRAKGLPMKEVPAFIKASPANLYDPFTEEPFKYDAAEKLLYTVYKDHNGASVKMGLPLNW